MLQADHLGASTFIEKGWSLISLGDFAGAVQSLEKALALSPDDIQALSLLGWAQMLSESYDEALGTFSKVLMREPANALALVAARTGACIVIVRHLNKMSGPAALYRGGGSIGIIGAARMGLLVGRDPDNPEQRVLAFTKSNLARAPEVERQC